MNCNCGAQKREIKVIQNIKSFRKIAKFITRVANYAHIRITK